MRERNGLKDERVAEENYKNPFFTNPSMIHITFMSSGEVGVLEIRKEKAPTNLISNMLFYPLLVCKTSLINCLFTSNFFRLLKRVFESQ